MGGRVCDGRRSGRLDDLVADLLGLGVEIEQDPCHQTFVLRHQAEQDVLGADVVVSESPGLFLRQDDHLTGSLCKSLEHAP
jgi:hypothetical protein